MTWHATDDLLLRFGTEPETLDDVTASSVETHLVGCDRCRATLAQTMRPAAVEASWAAVADRIDRPRPSIIERGLTRIGVADHQARLVAATRALQARWLSAIVVLVAGSVAVSHSADSDGPFLLVAPLVPLLAVAAAFAGGGDPAGESAASTPVAGVGLVLRRAVSVLAIVLPLLVIGTVAMPALHLEAAAWVLPAFAMTLGAIALSRLLRIEVAAGVLAGTWYGSLFLAVFVHRTSTPPPTPELVPLALPGQVAALVVIAAATAALVVRRDLLFALAGRTR
jgi:hypothetical protein